MKKLFLLLSLASILALAGCSSSEPAKQPTPPASSSSAAEAKSDPGTSKPTEKTVVKKEVTNSGAEIIEYSDGTKTYTGGKRAEKYKLNGDAKIGHFKR